MPPPTQNGTFHDNERHPLPHSEEAEQGVLGSMLIASNDAIPLCLRRITDDHFYIPAHRTAFHALKEQWNAGRAIDLITFTQTLRDQNLLETIGGPPAVTHLVSFVPTAANVEHYLDIVCEKKRRRDAILHAEKAKVRAYDERVDFADANSDGDFPPMTDAAALVEQEKEIPRDLVEGLLHVVGKLVLGGASKSFKTFMLVNLAVSVATGADFLRWPTQSGRVLFINLEIQASFFARRIAKICEARAIKLSSLKGNFDVWNLRGFATDLSRMLPLLLCRVRPGDYCLIILDPIYKLLGARDENRAGDIAGLLNDVERLAVHSNAAVAFGAHFSKGNQAQKESIDRIGGSGVFARDPDSILTFTKHEKTDCFTVDAVLRNHVPIEPFVVKWEYPVMRIAESLDPERLKKPVGRRQEYASADLLDLLDEPLTSAEWQSLAQKELGLSESTFFRRLREIRKRGEAVQGPDGKWQRK